MKQLTHAFQLYDVPQTFHVIDSIPDGIVVTSNKGEIIYANPTFAHFIGTTKKKIEGSNLTEALGKWVLFDEYANTFIPQDFPFTKVYQGDQFAEATILFQDKKTGKKRWAVVKSAPIMVQNQQLPYITSIFHDISKEKDQDTQREMVMAAVSHDIKSLLTSVKAYGQILQKRAIKKTDEFSFQYLTKMDAQLDKLGKIIVDLLEVSKISSRKLHLQKETVNIGQFITSVIEDMKITSGGHNIIVKSNIKEQVFADKSRLGRVFVNLLANAIKYSPSHKPIIVRMESMDNKVTISIQDFGIGISQEEQKKIFDKFYQATQGERNTEKGLGIGLFIAKAIVEAHNGSIWVESTLEKGATFFVSLPVYKYNSIQQDNNQSLPLATLTNIQKQEAHLLHNQKHILLIDDDASISEAISAVLKNEGYAVTSETSGKKGLQNAQETHPNLILLDFFLPGENTAALITRFKESNKTKHIPIILTSASNAAEKSAKQWKLDDFLAKPFSIDTLLAMIENHIVL